MKILIDAFGGLSFEEDSAARVALPVFDVEELEVSEHIGTDRWVLADMDLYLDNIRSGEF